MCGWLTFGVSRPTAGRARRGRSRARRSLLSLGRAFFGRGRSGAGRGLTLELRQEVVLHALRRQFRDAIDSLGETSEMRAQVVVMLNVKQPQIGFGARDAILRL